VTKKVFLLKRSIFSFFADTNSGVEMKRLLIIAILVVLCGCTSDDTSGITKPDPVEIHWSLSGTFGNVVVDSVKADTELPRMVKRTGTSTMHLDGFDTVYFEKKISLRHLQVNAGDEVDIDDNGNFTFDNQTVFGLCENTNSIRIIPRTKVNVTLQPSTIILYSYNNGYYQYQ
jgi:hypothetical protein